MGKICFYHNDLDGICSAAIVHNKNLGYELRAINYNEEDEKLKDITDSILMFVDYCPTTDSLDKLLNSKNAILILDHHKTTEERVEEFKELRIIYGSENLEWTITKDLSGCGNVWQEFNRGVECPTVVTLVQDYDLWKYEYSYHTENFVNGIVLENGWDDPSNNLWNNLLAYWTDIYQIQEGTSLLSKIMLCGLTVTQYKESNNKSILKDYGYEVDFEGYRVLACNCPKNNSKLFGEAYNHYPFVIMYAHGAKGFTVSLYSSNKDIDVSEIAKKYGGGGHKGASGFTITELPFSVTYDWGSKNG